MRRTCLIIDEAVYLDEAVYWRVSLLARSIDSIVYWRNPKASAGVLSAGLGFFVLPLDHDFLLSYCGPTALTIAEPLTFRYSSTAIACSASSTSSSA